MTRSPALTPEAFAAEFKTASRKLWCLAAAILGCRAQAEDVLQEAALTALDRLDTFEPGSNFAGWMAKIVRFTALNHSRRHYRTRELGGEVADLGQRPGAAPAGEARVDRSGRLDPAQPYFDDAVMRALQQLGEMPRASFLLRTLMGMSYKEIATLLEIPEGTAMSHVHRSRALLRELLLADQTFEPCAAWRAS